MTSTLNFPTYVLTKVVFFVWVIPDKSASKQKNLLVIDFAWNRSHYFAGE